MKRIAVVMVVFEVYQPQIRLVGGTRIGLSDMIRVHIDCPILENLDLTRLGYGKRVVQLCLNPFVTSRRSLVTNSCLLVCLVITTLSLYSVTVKRSSHFITSFWVVRYCHSTTRRHAPHIFFRF